MKTLETMNADVVYSVEWKKISWGMIQEAYPDQKKLEAAIWWCGNNGHVVRTVKANSLSAYTSFVSTNYISIINGSFDVLTVPSYQGKRPLSWISKICHIINPWDYPLIFDGNNRNSLGLDEQNINAEMKKRRHKKSRMSRQEAYTRESSVWCGFSGDVI